MKRSLFASILMTIASVGCQATQTGPVPEQPSVQPSASITIPLPSPTPVTSPPVPAAVSVSPWVPSPDEPKPTSDISIVEHTFVQFMVFDEQSRPLPETQILVRSTHKLVPFETSAITDQQGYTKIDRAPSGVILEFTASKPGYSPRKRFEVLKANKSMLCNCYSFGTGPKPEKLYFDDPGVSYNSLTRKPEVTQVRPSRNGMLSLATDPFELSFSKPVEPRSVEDNFLIQAYAGRTLSVDDQPTFAGPRNAALTDGERILDKRAFDFEWNEDRTKVTLRFKPGWQLPVDRDFGRLPAYQVSFRNLDNRLRSADGEERSDKPFKLTDGDFEASYQFLPQADTTAPRLESLQRQSESLRLSFSEPMRLQIISRAIGGGMKHFSEAPASFEQEKISDRDAAQNYRISLRLKGQLILERVSWASLGGFAQLEDNTSGNRVVLLKMPRSEDMNQLLARGDEIEVEVAESVLDPAGNPVDPTHRRQRIILSK